MLSISAMFSGRSHYACPHICCSAFIITIIECSHISISNHSIVQQQFYAGSEVVVRHYLVSSSPFHFQFPSFYSVRIFAYTNMVQVRRAAVTTKLNENTCLLTNLPVAAMAYKTVSILVNSFLFLFFLCVVPHTTIRCLFVSLCSMRKISDVPYVT